jgi:sugar O-acyltransferase (sialic acid O-acetyltransferase NeuD family)
VNGIGSIPGSKLRLDIYQKFIDKGFHFKTVISGNAIVSPYALLSDGVQIMSGVVIQAGAVINENSIINTSAVIDHDCNIGCHNHIAPSATLSGGVITGDCVHIGTGSNIIQLIKIGSGVVVGAGATVTKDIESGRTVYPAKTFIR